MITVFSGFAIKIRQEFRRRYSPIIVPALSTIYDVPAKKLLAQTVLKPKRLCQK